MTGDVFRLKADFGFGTGFGEFVVKVAALPPDRWTRAAWISVDVQAALRESLPKAGTGTVCMIFA